MSYDALYGCADFDGMSDEEIVAAAKAGNDGATEYRIEKYKILVKSRARTYFLIGAAQIYSGHIHLAAFPVYIHLKRHLG